MLQLRDGSHKDLYFNGLSGRAERSGQRRRSMGQERRAAQTPSQGGGTNYGTQRHTCAALFLALFKPPDRSLLEPPVRLSAGENQRRCAAERRLMPDRDHHARASRPARRRQKSACRRTCAKQGSCLETIGQRLRGFDGAASRTRQDGRVPRQPFAQPRGYAFRLLPALHSECAFLVWAAALSVGVTPEYQVHVDSL